jgi:hypothetical protein
VLVAASLAAPPRPIALQDQRDGNTADGMDTVSDAHDQTP